MACVSILFMEIRVHLQCKTLSLDMAMIQWQGCPKLGTSDPRKITKYAVLVRMVCEAVSGYICKTMIHTAEGQKLDDTVLSVVHRKLVQNHHFYQAIFVIV
jgi:hypothetical protein